MKAPLFDRPLRIRCMTYNTNRGKANEDLFKLVFNSNLKDKIQLADIYAISFQEIAGLHLTFPSWTSLAIQNQHQLMIKALSAASKFAQNGSFEHNNQDFEQEKFNDFNLISSPTHGGLGLLVYARKSTVLSQINQVQTSSASCGLLNLMNNKGAVGVRLSLDQEQSFTFINAHLTAHDSGILARNRDYQTILNRLVFQSDNGHHYSIYDTHHLFFMGDLNYRISLTPLTNSNLKPITKLNLNDIINENRHSSLFPDHETLFHQHSCQKVLVGLKEPPIKFKPTYKYKIGKSNEFVSFNHRLPGWTDRIFYASSLAPESSEFPQNCLSVVEYQSIEDYNSSDHKPVYAEFDLLPYFHENSLNEKFLTNRPSITIDKWRKEKILVGFVLDQTCGIVLLSVVFLGFGNMTLGAIHLASLVLFSWNFFVGF